MKMASFGSANFNKTQDLIKITYIQSSGKRLNSDPREKIIQIQRNFLG